MDTLDYVRIYGWVAAAINVTLLGMLAILAPGGREGQGCRAAAPDPNQRQN